MKTFHFWLADFWLVSTNQCHINVTDWSAHMKSYSQIYKTCSTIALIMTYLLFYQSSVVAVNKFKSLCRGWTNSALDKRHVWQEEAWRNTRYLLNNSWNAWDWTACWTRIPTNYKKTQKTEKSLTLGLLLFFFWCESFQFVVRQKYSIKRTKKNESQSVSTIQSLRACRMMVINVVGWRERLIQ